MHSCHGVQGFVADSIRGYVLHLGFYVIKLVELLHNLSTYPMATAVVPSGGQVPPGRESVVYIWVVEGLKEHIKDLSFFF